MSEANDPRDADARAIAGVARAGTAGAGAGCERRAAAAAEG